MKILFIAPRFHTNQLPLIKLLISKGHKVNFLVERFGISEDYDILLPKKIRKSIFTSFIHFFINAYSKNDVPIKLQKFFIPNIFFVFFSLIKIKPDLIIFRDRSLTTVLYFIVSSILKIKMKILYNQTPVELDFGNINFLFLKKIFRKLTPKVRVTPVKLTQVGKPINSHTYFLPFFQKSVDFNKKFFKDGKIRILSIGKFYERKQHLLLLRSLKALYYENYELTIVGEISSEMHSNYFSKVKDFILENNLSNKVKLYFNQPFNKMSTFYINSDIFILPSSFETAAISVLEAISFKNAVIVSNTNGLNTYFNNMKEIILFKDNNENSLSRSISKLFINRSLVKKIAYNGFEALNSRYSSEIYYDKLDLILKKEFNYVNFKNK